MRRLGYIPVAAFSSKVLMSQERAVLSERGRFSVAVDGGGASWIGGEEGSGQEGSRLLWNRCRASPWNCRREGKDSDAPVAEVDSAAMGVLGESGKLAVGVSNGPAGEGSVTGAARSLLTRFESLVVLDAFERLKKELGRPSSRVITTEGAE